MSVWICIPSLRPNGGTLPAWKAAGYMVAAYTRLAFPCADMTILEEPGEYKGCAWAKNLLTRAVMKVDSEAEWFVYGGDDTLPDPAAPAQISQDCARHFGGTFGVMQPIGDLTHWPASRIDRIAGSPWIGREFARRSYAGNGPWCEYRHCWDDEELQLVAQNLGVFWQRKDLTHTHLHPQRPGGMLLEPAAQKAIDDSYLAERALFRSRRDAGFPGHECIS